MADDVRPAVGTLGEFAGLVPWQRDALDKIGHRASQCRRIFVYLCLHGPTGCQRLARACNVASSGVTSRMSELRKLGLADSVRGLDSDDDGKSHWTAIYSVRVPSPQLDLFAPA
jgi:hypothetical protein